MALDKVVADKLLPFLKALADSALSDAGRLKFDKEHPQHLYAICTYGTIIETTYDILALADAKQVTSIPIILRALLDAYASFRACVHDPNHFKAMYATFIKEKLRLIDAVAANPDNPYLKAIAQAIDVKTEKASLEQELKGIEKQGYKSLRPWQEFEVAGLSSEYQSLYWQLCLHAHNNVSALEERHLNKKGSDFEVVFFKEEDPADLVRYFDSVCGLLLDATRTLHNKLGSGLDERYERLAAQLEEIRKDYA